MTISADALDGFRQRFNAIVSNIERVIQGKRHVSEQVAICLIAGGHVLIEDVPGVGKTLLAKSLARSIDCTFSRIQFTPDLLAVRRHRGVGMGPGAGRVRLPTRSRCSPTSCSVTRSTGPAPRPSRRCSRRWRSSRSPSTPSPGRSSAPFLVVATQNPIEHEGTYPLPEAQLDRFMMRIAMGYPSREKELEMLDTHGAAVELRRDWSRW